MLNMRESGPADPARVDGHLQLRRLAPTCISKRRNRGHLREQEGRSRHRIHREQPGDRRTWRRCTGCLPSTTSSSSPATITPPCKGCTFELIDQGYAMCLVDDGTRHRHKNRPVLHRHRRQLQRAVHLCPVLPDGWRARDFLLRPQGNPGKPGEPDGVAAAFRRRPTASTRRIWWRRSTRCRTSSTPRSGLRARASRRRTSRSRPSAARSRPRRSVGHARIQWLQPQRRSAPTASRSRSRRSTPPTSPIRSPGRPRSSH